MEFRYFVCVKLSFGVDVVVEEYNVIGILGSVGTPTAQAMLPYLQSHNVPLLFPFTGARSLRLPFVPLVLNTRASYDVSQQMHVCIFIVSSQSHVSI